jgi:hypothetical protein
MTLRHHSLVMRAMRIHTAKIDLSRGEKHRCVLERGHCEGSRRTLCEVQYHTIAGINKLRVGDTIGL